jgi:hypothetical protein
MKVYALLQLKPHGLCEVNTVLNLLKECFNWMLGVPCFAHVFKILLNINSCDTAIREEEVIKHVSDVVLAKPTRSSFKISMYIGSTNVIICFFSALWTVLYVLKSLVPTVFVCTDLCCCPAALNCGWGPSRKFWVFPGGQGRDHFIGIV